MNGTSCEGGRWCSPTFIIKGHPSAHTRTRMYV